MKSKRRGFSLIWVVLLLPLFFGVGSMIYAEMDAYERLVGTSTRYWKLQIAANMAIKQGEVWLLQEVERQLLELVLLLELLVLVSGKN